MTLDASTINFKNGIQSRDPGMLDSYIKAKGTAEHYPDISSFERVFHNIYTFHWGFIGENTRYGYVWDVFVRDAWIAGTDQYFDRFLTAHKHMVHPGLEKLANAGGPFFSFDDGISNWSSLSYAFMSDMNEAQLRDAFTQTVVAKLPAVIEKALDMTHAFNTEWYCT